MASCGCVVVPNKGDGGPMVECVVLMTCWSDDDPYTFQTREFRPEQVDTKLVDDRLNRTARELTDAEAAEVVQQVALRVRLGQQYAQSARDAERCRTMVHALKTSLGES
jgi:hypothetical protein